MERYKAKKNIKVTREYVGFDENSGYYIHYDKFGKPYMWDKEDYAYFPTEEELKENFELVKEEEEE